MHHYEFTDINHALPRLAHDVINVGEEVGSRMGERVNELTHVGITLTNPRERYITLPGRRASLPSQIAETMWVLAGRDDIGWLGRYLPRAADFSDDGVTWRGAYGPRIRKWGGHLDQLAHVVRLLSEDPLSRRAVISIYDPAIDSQPGKDIPCNDFIQFTSRLGELDMHVFARSNDLIWGWSGINAFEWSVLQEIVAGILGIGVGRLHFSIGSLHVYDRHWKRADRIAEALPVDHDHSVGFDTSRLNHSLDDLINQWFAAEEFIRSFPQGARAAELIREFPEPMLRSWLAVIAWRWSGNEEYLAPYRGTSLYAAALQTPDSMRADVPDQAPAPDHDPFVEYVADLHAEKHAVYGPQSWKRRGESISILANIARKIDRLGVGGAGDTAADTVIDLLVYLLKYRLWLTDQGAPVPELLDGWEGSWEPGALSDLEQPVRHMLHQLTKHEAQMSEVPALISFLKYAFDDLEQAVEQRDALSVRVEAVGDMIPAAATVARALWNDEQGAAEMVQAYTFWKGDK